MQLSHEKAVRVPANISPGSVRIPTYCRLRCCKLVAEKRVFYFGARTMRTYQKLLAVIALSGMCFAAAAPSENEGAVKKSKKRVPTAEAMEQKPPCEACEAIKRLEDRIAAQQAEIDALKAAQQPPPPQPAVAPVDEEARAAAAAAKQQAEASAAAAAEANANANALKSDLADVRTTITTSALTTQEDQKRFSALEGLVGRFRFAGDVRVRYENFYQDVPGFHPRHRERIRARLGVEGKLNEDFSGGVYLASGAFTDPTSTNETLTNAFERKTVAWDRGWITYQPQNAKWLQLTGGKFAYTWIRTPNSFDNDLNPEGFSEKVSFDLHHNIVRNVTFTGLQFFFNESSSGADSFTVGGQVSSKLQLGRRIVMTPSLSVLNWHNPNVLLNEPASVTGSTTISCTSATPPVCTFPTGAFAPNGMTNATIGTSPNRTFASQFLYLDAILDTTINTGWDRFPVRLLLEYEQNLNAAAIPNGTNPNATDRSHLYLGDLSVGRFKEKNDVMFGYGIWRQEQDSVIASFVESDQRAPTNVFQQRLIAQWLVRKNTTAAYTFWFGRTLDTSLQNAVLAAGVVPGTREPLLRRMQFDLIYKF